MGRYKKPQSDKPRPGIDSCRGAQERANRMAIEVALRSGDLWSGLVLAALGGYIVVAGLALGLPRTAEGPARVSSRCGTASRCWSLSLALVVSSARAPRSASHLRSTGARIGRALVVWLALAVCGGAAQAARFRAQPRAADLVHRGGDVSPPGRTAAAVALAPCGGFYPCFSLRSASRCRSASSGSSAGPLAMEILTGLLQRLCGRARAGQPVLVLRRRVARHGRRRAAGPGTAGDHRDAAAADLQA